MGHRANDRSDRTLNMLATSIFPNNAVLSGEDGSAAPSAGCVGRRVCPATETEQGSEAPVITEIFHRNARCGAQEISLLAFWVQAGFGRKMRPCAKPSTPNRANTCAKCWWRCAKRPESRSANWPRNWAGNITWLDDWSWVSAAWM